MPSILHPYVLLGLLIGALGMFGSGVSVGYKWSQRAHVAAVAAAQVKAIDDANTAVDLAIQRTLSAAKKEADARLASRTAKLKGEIDAAKKSRPECARDAESVSLLNSAIDSANGKEDAPVKLPDPVRTPASTLDWFRIGHPALGISSSGSVRPVSPPAQ